MTSDEGLIGECIVGEVLVKNRLSEGRLAMYSSRSAVVKRCFKLCYIDESIKQAIFPEIEGSLLFRRTQIFHGRRLLANMMRSQVV